MPPVILWLRRDLRLSDHPAWHKALATGQPVVPLFIMDDLVDSLGAAPKWRLGLSIDAISKDISDLGSRLILRSGDALKVITGIIKETGATAVFWTRSYDPMSIERDTKIKSALKDQNINAVSTGGHLLFEPWTVENKQGAFFKVYTPMWKAVKDRDVGELLPKPSNLRPPTNWPTSENLDDWQLGAQMKRGAEVVGRYVCVGEAKARQRLGEFIDGPVQFYKEKRDFPSLPATSKLSENLTYGEISAREIWHAGQGAQIRGAQGAEHFLKELVWREFAYHLIYHTPEITHSPWRAEWQDFPWEKETGTIKKWQRGMTGEPFVDAGMRELYVTGLMHNRVRMIVGSYLTKHLLTHWTVGRDWFADCLIDWDPASNAMGWQWIAGCGPDAAPYFRVFNPETQAEKFDQDGSYRASFLRNWRGFAGKPSDEFFEAIPRSWRFSAEQEYPNKMIELAEGRERALSAYASRKKHD